MANPFLGSLGDQEYQGNPLAGLSPAAASYYRSAYGNLSPMELAKQVKRDQEKGVTHDLVQPDRPDFLSFLNPDGTLKNNYTLGNRSIDGSEYRIPTFDELRMDPSGLNRIKAEAFSTGPSSWAKLAQKNLMLQQGTALDAASKEGARGAAQSWADMSRLGGADAGAGERLSRQANRDSAFARNAILRQGMTESGNIGMQDASNKMDLLKTIPGFENQAAQLKLSDQAQRIGVNQFNTTLGSDIAKYNTDMGMKTDQFNINNAMQGLEGQNAFNQGTYQDKMKAWAAEKQANATANSGK